MPAVIKEKGSKIDGVSGQIMRQKKNTHLNNPVSSLSYKKDFSLLHSSVQNDLSLELFFSDDEHQCMLYQDNRMIVFDVQIGHKVSENKNEMSNEDQEWKLFLDGLNQTQRQLFLLSSIQSWPQGFEYIQ